MVSRRVVLSHTQGWEGSVRMRGEAVVRWSVSIDLRGVCMHAKGHPATPWQQGSSRGSSRVACKPSACIVNAVRQGGGVGGRPRTLRLESLRSPWGQVKSTKGFGNFAIPTSGSPGGLGHGEQLWKKKNLKNRS